MAHLAASQHGLVSRKQVLRAGFGPNQWRRLEQAAGWEWLHAGVIRNTAAPRTWEQSLMAGCLAVDGVASHRSAGVLWGIPGIEPLLEITLPPSRRAQVRGFVVHSSGHLEKGDQKTRKAIPVTSLPRTVIDLRLELPDQAPAMLDHILAHKRVALELLLRVLRDLGVKGRKGAAGLESLLLERQGRKRHVDSDFQRNLEEVIGAASKDGRLPPVLFEHPVKLRDGRWRYLDAAFPGTGHGVEGDSYEHHSTQPDWEKDHTRNLELMEAGWVTIPITPRMLERDPEGVVRRVAAILNRAGVWRAQAS